MKFRNILFVALAIILVVSGYGAKYYYTHQSIDEPIIINGISVPPLPELEPERLSSGSVLYTNYCASCHGIKLEGQPDWKIPLDDGSFPAPPHDSSGHTWHHPDSLLLDITANGGSTPNSRMPAYKNQLTGEEMVAILDFIKSNWGDEERKFQWWITVTQD